MTETILVTGGCGFIGANLIPMLIKKGYSIRILDNLSRGKRKFLDGVSVDIYEGDICDSVAVSEALVSVSKIVHLAAYGSVVESVEEPSTNYQNNVQGTFTLLDGARKSGVKKVVFASTGGALIGNAAPPVNEDSIPRPISPYGASKLCCEAYCSAFAHSYNMSIIALRFANVVGPISWHKKGAVTAFMKAIMNGDNIKIYGDGKATRDFLYVGDLCEGIILALEKELPGFTPIHLASGREVSVKELAEIIKVTGGVPEHPVEHMPKRIGEVERNFADYSLARRLFGFSPKIRLEDAMSITWKWFQSYHD